METAARGMSSLAAEAVRRDWGSPGLDGRRGAALGMKARIELELTMAEVGRSRAEVSGMGTQQRPWMRTPTSSFLMSLRKHPFSSWALVSLSV